MPPATTLHDITTLVRSSHPLIAIETLEEERVRALLRDAADELSAPLFEWSLTRGLQRVPGGQAIHGTADALGVMKHLRALTVDGLFHLKDFAVHLGDAALARSTRDVAQQFARTRATLLMTGDPITLPPALAAVAGAVPLGAPRRHGAAWRAERRARVPSVATSDRDRHRTGRSRTPARRALRLDGRAGATSAVVCRARGRSPGTGRHSALDRTEGPGRPGLRPAGVRATRRQHVRAGRFCAAQGLVGSSTGRLLRRGEVLEPRPAARPAGGRYPRVW